MFGVLQHRIDPAHPPAGAARVVRRHDGLQQGAPLHGLAVIVGIGLSEAGLPGLLRPQLQGGLVGAQAVVIIGVLQGLIRTRWGVVGR